MIIKNEDLQPHNVFQKIITKSYHLEESSCIKELTQIASSTHIEQDKIDKVAYDLVKKVRETRLKTSGLDAFMIKYDLSSDEGIVLMCLAEALLRIPDKFTADKLIEDKLTSANWEQHLGTSDSLFVNAATWSLMLTGKVLDSNNNSKKLKGSLTKFLGNRSRPVVRRAVLHGMKILGQQYVMGGTIKKAIKRAKENEKKGYTYSYDMLGEAAFTMEDADYYYNKYSEAIDVIGKSANKDNEKLNPGISVKLSALHPRYQVSQSQRVQKELYPKLLKLMQMAKSYNIGLNIDAEESERLEISLEMMERLASEKSLKDWNGIGFVVQAYQKRAIFVLDYLADLAKRNNIKFMVRLVKGAYWDSEIKHSQVEGYDGYPVFTRKCHTDISYIACVKKLFTMQEYIYPQFATHNARTVSAVIEFSGDYTDYEFQCLHGMGDSLYNHIVDKKSYNIPCRIYAPVGGYKHLLPYLVRRLLENGANTSFVNRIVDANLPIEDLIESPIHIARNSGFTAHNEIKSPVDMFDNRKNSQSYNLDNIETLKKLSIDMKKAMEQDFIAMPILNGKDIKTSVHFDVLNPADNSEIVGKVYFADKELANKAMNLANESFKSWNKTAVKKRAKVLNKMADLLERDMPKFMAIAIKEAGKTLPNAVSEVREAIDFCRYYAVQSIIDFETPKELKGPTGESNKIQLSGRGTIVCISPWNFPLAIFLGEITASLASGNTVVAKPAEQTSIIAYEAVKLLFEAGLPNSALQLMTGKGLEVGASLIEHNKNAGVIFTGSTEVAKNIQLTLAQKKGAIVPFIAETGGQNAMIVDSSALPEQVVNDVIMSAFDSAGQRCSALRVLFLQDDIADHVLTMLTGAMKEIKVGDPQYISTDVGPVIDNKAFEILNSHIIDIQKNGKLIYQTPFLATDTSKGTFITPTVIEINDLSVLTREKFGPILHVIRFKGKELEKVVDMINNTGYGLTFGVHSRIENAVNYLIENINVGNIYVNRNTVGAVVGVQPFGGQGLSGTGPKAGGPFYLQRLAYEKTISIDTTASGGNASLMSIGE